MVAARNIKKESMGNEDFLFETTETGNYDHDLSADEDSSSCLSSSDASYEDHHQGSLQQLGSSQFHSQGVGPEDQPRSCRFEGGTAAHFLPLPSSSSSFSCRHQFPAGLDNTKMPQNSFCSNNNNSNNDHRSNSNNENSPFSMCAATTFPLRTCVGGGVNKQAKKKRSSKTVYVPHKDKPAQVVDKRNARERRRVEAVNDAFKRLRKLIPYENRNKRLSKFKTLRIAINYIRNLQDLVSEDGEQGSIPGCPAPAQWQCDPRQEVPNHVMAEYKYSGSHDFGYDTTPMMQQYSAHHSTVYGQYHTSHPGYSSGSPVTMEMNGNVAMEMSTSCSRWNGPQVQLSPHNTIYRQHFMKLMKGF